MATGSAPQRCLLAHRERLRLLVEATLRADYQLPPYSHPMTTSPGDEQPAREFSLGIIDFECDASPLHDGPWPTGVDLTSGARAGSRGVR